MSEPQLVRFEGVSKRFGDQVAVDDVTLDIRPGEFFALLGPSGCGKTTLMRMLAGFETPDAGRILLNGEDLGQIPPHQRPLNMMFQSYALFPHMSVEKNIAFGLKMEGLPRREIADRVAEMLALVRLEGFAKRRPDQLSGGQKQRAALARALAKRPRMLLLDEPLAALDKRLREETQFELKAIQARLGAAFMIVTHDQDEAMVLADRMAVMDAGRIIQVGAPREIYERPASRRVAGFIGDVNLFEPADAPGFEVNGQWLAVRPERMWIDRARRGPIALEGQVDETGYLGDWTTVVVRLSDGRRVRVSRPNTGGEAGFAKGDSVLVGFDPAQAVVLSQ